MEDLPSEALIQIVQNLGDIYDRVNVARVNKRFYELSQDRCYWQNLSDDLIITQLNNSFPKVVTVNRNTYTLEVFVEFLKFLVRNSIQVNNLLLAGIDDPGLVDYLIQFTYSVNQNFQRLTINMRKKPLPWRFASLANFCSFENIVELGVAQVILDESLVWFLERCGAMPKLERFRFADVISGVDYEGDRLRYMVENVFPNFLTGKVFERLEIDLWGMLDLYVKACCLPSKIKYLIVTKCPNFLSVIEILRQQNQLESVVDLKKLDSIVPTVHRLTASVYLIRIRNILKNLDDISLADDSFAYNYDLFVFKTFANYQTIIDEKCIKIVSRFSPSIEFQTLMRSVQNWSRVQTGVRCDTGSRMTSAFDDRIVIRTRANNEKFVLDLLFFSM